MTGRLARLARLAALPLVAAMTLTACSEDGGTDNAAEPPAPSRASSAAPADEMGEEDPSSESSVPEEAASEKGGAESSPAEDGTSESPKASPTSTEQASAEPSPVEESPADEASPTADPSPSSEESSPAAAPPSGETPPEGRDGDCGPMGAEEALHAGLKKLNAKDPAGAWHTNGADTSVYDPCADISAIAVTIEYATGGSPWMVMLFHRGEYLGTATAQPVGMGQILKQRSDDVVEVTYLYPKPGESNAERSGRATSSFRWDPQQQKTIMGGELPPTPEEREKQAEEKVDGPPAGNDAPQAEVVVDGVARIISASGKIGCEIAEDAAECGVEAYLKNEHYGTVPGTDMTKWWVVIPADDEPFITGKSDVPNYRGENDGKPGQNMDWNESVRHGQVTCQSLRKGLVCENEASGYSVTMNRKGYTVDRLK